MPGYLRVVLGFLTPDLAVTLTTILISFLLRPIICSQWETSNAPLDSHPAVKELCLDGIEHPVKAQSVPDSMPESVLLGEELLDRVRAIAQHVDELVHQAMLPQASPTKPPLDGRGESGKGSRCVEQPAEPMVLVVGQYAPIITLLGHMLRRLGFAPLSASSSAEAVEASRQHRIDLALADLAMPEASARSALRQINPSVRCCYLTGGCGTPLNVLLSQGAVYLLNKPFTLSDLAAAVNAPAGHRGESYGSSRTGIGSCALSHHGPPSEAVPGNQGRVVDR